MSPTTSISLAEAKIREQLTNSLGRSGVRSTVQYMPHNYYARYWHSNEYKVRGSYILRRIHKQVAYISDAILFEKLTVCNQPSEMLLALQANGERLSTLAPYAGCVPPCVS